MAWSGRTCSIIITAVGVLAGACGGGAADDAAPSEDAPGVSAADGAAPDVAESPAEADPGPEEYVSDDGLLRLSAPADDVELTMEALASSTVQAGALDQFVGGFELGPDGATFDPPLQGFIELADAEIERGVAVLHVHDGDAEPLPTERVAGGLTFEISGFSAIEIYTVSDVGELLAPASAVVDEGFEITFRWGDQITPLSQYIAPGDESGLVASGPIEVNDRQFVCTAVGSGAVGYRGTFTQARIGREAVFFPYRHREIDATARVECIDAAVAIEPSDTRCVDTATGDLAEGCPTVDQLNPRFRGTSAEGGVLEIEFLLDLATLSPGTEATVSIGGRDPAGGWRFLELSADGSTGFHGSGFENYEPDPGGPVCRPTLDALTCSGVTAHPELTPPTVALPGGLTLDGEPIPAVEAELTEWTLYVETDDGRQGVYYWDGPSLFARMRDG